MPPEFTDELGDTPASPAGAAGRDVMSSSLGGQWDVLLNEANVLELDRPAFRIGEGPWQGPLEIAGIDRQVRDALGAPPRGESEPRPRAARRIARRPRSVHLAMRFTFHVRAMPSGSLSLAIEHPQRFRIMLNGWRISTDAASGCWRTPVQQTLPLDPSLLCTGSNELAMECDYDKSCRLDTLRLLGNFGVASEAAAAAMVARPAALEFGDIAGQGLPFYGGSVTYWRRIDLGVKLKAGQRVIVRVPAFEGRQVRVFGGGLPAGVIDRQSGEVDVTHRVQADKLDLRLELLTTRPTAPDLTVSARSASAPAGLMAPPQLIVRQGV